MAENRYFEILEKVYRLTNDTTPRSFDCGEKCGKKCCGNLSKDEHKSGMTLLPYEKEFLLCKGASFEFQTGNDGDVLICDGSCDRNIRPFACRIFPYYIDIKADGIKIKKDLRAGNVCPLLTSRTDKRANIHFLRSMKKAARILMKEKCFTDELVSVMEFNVYLNELYRKMLK